MITEPLYNKGDIKAIFSSLAKNAVKCMEQALDTTKSWCLDNEHKAGNPTYNLPR